MKTIPIISKSLVQSHRQCAKRAWLENAGNVTPTYSASDAALLEQGQQVHQSARTLFPSAERVKSGLSFEGAAEQTQSLLAQGQVFITGAGFVAAGVAIQADVVEKTPDGLRVTEIKSGTSIKDAYLDDCALQFACITGSGAKVASFAIMHPSREMARPAGGTGAEVFVSEDVTNEAYWRSVKAEQWIADCKSTLAGTEPAIAPGDQCSEPNPCPFSGHCGKPVENTDPDRIEFLPSKAGKIKECIEAGITKITDVPMGDLIHPRNKLVHKALMVNGPVIVREFAESLKELGYPRSFIDFEAAAFAVPRFDGMRAHQSLVFQWSCHRVEQEGFAPSHMEFLDVTGGDPRREFAQSLLQAVGTEDHVFVYSAYEKTRLKELALEFPDLQDALMHLVGRLVDLLSLARQGFYHPAMLGSWSLKKIVPLLPKTAGSTNYDDLDGVAEGLGAQAAYMEQINPDVVGFDKEVRRLDMLRYCKTDTEGLVRFVDYIEGSLVKSPPSLQMLEAA